MNRSLSFGASQSRKAITRGELANARLVEAPPLVVSLARPTLVEKTSGNSQGPAVQTTQKLLGEPPNAVIHRALLVERCRAFAVSERNHAAEAPRTGKTLEGPGV